MSLQAPMHQTLTTYQANMTSKMTKSCLVLLKRVEGRREGKEKASSQKKNLILSSILLKMNHSLWISVCITLLLQLLFPSAPVSQAAAWGPGGTALSLTSTHSHRHYHAFISSPAARHGQPPLGPPGYFTNKLLLISHRAPLLVIKEPINGAEKGEAFK